MFVTFPARLAVAVAAKKHSSSRRWTSLLTRGLLFISVALGAPPVLAQDGAALAQKVFDRPDGRDMTTLSRMVLTEKGRAPRIRELVTYRRDPGKGDIATLIRFLHPEDISGTGLLSVDKQSAVADQWLYLPALDRVRRISSERKGGRFVGSDLYFEDLQTRSPSKDTHRLLPRRREGGVLCDGLESVPVKRSNSVYRKRISWIDPQTLLAHRVDYYENDPKVPSKRWLLRSKKQIQGYWTVTDSRMVDLRSGHETRLVVDVAVYDKDLPAHLFTTRTLADETLESDYRP
jgi:hypothetical protein